MAKLVWLSPLCGLAILLSIAHLPDVCRSVPVTSQPIASPASVVSTKEDVRVVVNVSLDDDFKHSQKHANDSSAESGDDDLKSRIKDIHSNNSSKESSEDDIDDVKTRVKDIRSNSSKESSEDDIDDVKTRVKDIRSNNSSKESSEDDIDDVKIRVKVIHSNNSSKESSEDDIDDVKIRVKVIHSNNSSKESSEDDIDDVKIRVKDILSNNSSKESKEDDVSDDTSALEAVSEDRSKSRETLSPNSKEINDNATSWEKDVSMETNEDSKSVKRNNGTEKNDDDAENDSDEASRQSSKETHDNSTIESEDVDAAKDLKTSAEKADDGVKNVVKGAGDNQSNETSDEVTKDERQTTRCDTGKSSDDEMKSGSKGERHSKTDSDEGEDKSAEDDADELEGFPVEDLDDDDLEVLMDVDDDIFLGQAGEHVAKMSLLETRKKSSLSINEVRRRKRVAPLAVRAVITAARALLQGVTRQPVTRSGSRLTRHYEKTGSYPDALRDFHSLRPENVKPLEGSKFQGLQGTVGSHKVTVRDGSRSGPPTLDVNSHGGNVVRKIRYEQKP